MPWGSPRCAPCMCIPCPCSKEASIWLSLLPAGALEEAGWLAAVDVATAGAPARTAAAPASAGLTGRPAKPKGMHTLAGGCAVGCGDEPVAAAAAAARCVLSVMEASAVVSPVLCVWGPGGLGPGVACFCMPCEALERLPVAPESLRERVSCTVHFVRWNVGICRGINTQSAMQLHTAVDDAGHR